METINGEYILKVIYDQVIETQERREECHGYHYFTDERITNYIEKVIIDINGFEIDITDRLTEVEIAQISESVD